MSGISQRIAGKTVAAAWRNGACLLIEFTDGTSITIGWKHPETGEPIKGEPVVVNQGVHIVQKGSELIHRRQM